MLASAKQLKKIFGVPVITDVVKLGSNKLYGFASCHDRREDWMYMIGGFLKLEGFWHAEMGCWESLIEEQSEENNSFYNFAFFEVEEINNEFVPVGIIMKAIMDKKMKYLSDGFENKHETVMIDLTCVTMDTFEKFEWEI